ncbi:MAG TPA: nuclear transport factor 2 family protein [Steroidobacteraceae bacterium]|nr:nuclear transport factor 2 family protein [Steroidobacteraceae bacterium]
MKLSAIGFFLCCLVGFWAPAAAAAPAPADFAGNWSGSFEIHFADGRIANETAWLALQQVGSTVSGTVGPKAEQQGPIREVSARGSELTFVADSTQGKMLKFVLKREGESLSGEATGDIGDDHVRVVLKTKRADGAAAQARDPLYEKMLALDTGLFESFNQCADPAQLAKHAAMFAKDVEFYHDLGGVEWGADAVIDSTRKNVCGKFHRELDAATFRAYPIPGFGAMTTGTHRFCHTPTTCEGVGEFTMVWKQTGETWQVTRVLSFAHRATADGEQGRAH